jgi:hypothetical protein
MQIKSDALRFPRRHADDEDLRDLQYSLKRDELVDELEFNETDPVIEVRFGPSSSKYMPNAKREALHRSKKDEKTEYEKLFWREDDEDTGHLFVTREAIAANQVWEFVENWKSAEIRINGERATETRLESMIRRQAPVWAWILVIIIMLIAAFFEFVASL